MSNKISDLDPKIRNKAEAAFIRMKTDKKLKDMGVKSVIISESRRELAVQMAYYSRGRCPRDVVRAFYKRCGLYTPTDKECDTPNTQTLNSKHIDGLAVDFVPVDPEGDCWWDAPDAVWDRMGAIGEECGLSWGGRWTGFVDKPHFEV